MSKFKNGIVKSNLASLKLVGAMKNSMKRTVELFAHLNSIQKDITGQFQEVKKVEQISSEFIKSVKSNKSSLVQISEENERMRGHINQQQKNIEKIVTLEILIVLSS